VTYLIGISSREHESSGLRVTCGVIKQQVLQFLCPVASQLDLEKNNLMVIHLIVSDEYSVKVLRHFTDQQSWVLDSGIYYKDGRKDVKYRSFCSERVDETEEDWLTVPPRCQVLVCSPKTLAEIMPLSPRSVFRFFWVILTKNDS
jgi:hypothetical protein